MSVEIKQIDPFVNIPLADLPVAGNESQGGTFLSDLRTLNIGDGGDNVFRADSQGIWLGAGLFVNAPFSVSMTGAITASSLTLIGGIIRFGKTSFTDATHDGYYQSSEGVYFGSVADATKFKFSIATGDMEFIGNHSGGYVGGQLVSNVALIADPTADITPLGLTISTHGVSMGNDGSSTSYVVLTWTAIATTNFDHYLIRFKKTALTYYSYVEAKTNTITVEGLTPNVSYDFGIASVNKFGSISAFSANVSMTTDKDATAPGTVASTAATGGIQYVILEWTHNTDADLAYYNIYRNTVNDSATATLIGKSQTTYFVDGGRTGGQIYYYWIKAVDTSANESAAFSTVRNATPRDVTSADVVSLAGDKVLIDGTVYLSNWRHSSDLTKIDGGDIYANSVTLTQLNFVPIQGSNVIASINASIEGIKIDADNISISGSTTFSSGYDPTAKVAMAGGNYASAASGARVLLFPSANIGVQVIDDAANNAFIVYVGGAGDPGVGDVIIGNYAGGQGIKYDKSASTTTFMGAILSSVITGGTIQTAATGQRMVIDSADNKMTFYNASDAAVVQIGGGTNLAYAVRVYLDNSTTYGFRVDAAHVGDIGFRYNCVGNYIATGADFQMTGATNQGKAININHDGNGGQGVYIDTSAGARAIQIANSGGGIPIYITNSGACETIYISHTNDANKGVEMIYSGRQQALYIASDDTDGATLEALYVGAANSNATGYAAKFFKTGSQAVVDIEQDNDSGDNNIGLRMAIVNAGAGTEYAFEFAGSEYIANATAVSGLTGVIKILTSDGLSYIPVYNSYS
jgi:hypothetical protein